MSAGEWKVGADWLDIEADVLAVKCNVCNVELQISNHPVSLDQQREFGETHKSHAPFAYLCRIIAPKHLAGGPDVWMTATDAR